MQARTNSPSKSQTRTRVFNLMNAGQDIRWVYVSMRSLHMRCIVRTVTRRLLECTYSCTRGGTHGIPMARLPYRAI